MIRIGNIIINGDSVFVKTKTYTKEEAREVVRESVIRNENYGWGDDEIRVENEYKRCGLEK